MHWIDPDHLPQVPGTIERFLANPHGELDGLLLSDGTEVHLPPHLSGEVQAALRLGDQVGIRGVRPRGAAMLAAVALDTATGRIVDNGPPHGNVARDALKAAAKARRHTGEADGMVMRPLHGPKGEVRGALLADGCIVRLPPHAAEQHAGLLQPGQHLAARGPSLPTGFGRVIEAKEVGMSLASLASLAPMAPKSPKHGKHKPGHPKPRKRHKPQPGPSAQA